MPEENLKPTNLLERLLPTKIQRAATDGIAAMIKHQFEARLAAQKLIEESQNDSGKR